MLTWTSRRVQIDERDVAVRLVEHVHILVQHVALLADDRPGQGKLAVVLFLQLAVLGLEIGDLGGLLVVVGLELVDLGQERLAQSDSCLLCSASRSALLSEAALAWTSLALLATLGRRFQTLPQPEVVGRHLGVQEGHVLEQLGQPVHRRHEVLVGLALVRVDDGLDAGPGFLQVLPLGAGLLGLLDGRIGGVDQGVDPVGVLLEERLDLGLGRLELFGLDTGLLAKLVIPVTASLAALLALATLAFSDSRSASERE